MLKSVCRNESPFLPVDTGVQRQGALTTSAQHSTCSKLLGPQKGPLSTLPEQKCRAAPAIPRGFPTPLLEETRGHNPWQPPPG